jgi:hypothetical protein
VRDGNKEKLLDRMENLEEAEVLKKVEFKHRSTLVMRKKNKMEMKSQQEATNKPQRSQTLSVAKASKTFSAC